HVKVPLFEPVEMRFYASEGQRVERIAAFSVTSAHINPTVADIQIQGFIRSLNRKNLVNLRVEGIVAVRDCSAVTANPIACRDSGSGTPCTGYIVCRIVISRTGIITVCLGSEHIVLGTFLEQTSRFFIRTNGL